MAKKIRINTNKLDYVNKKSKSLSKKNVNLTLKNKKVIIIIAIITMIVACGYYFLFCGPSIEKVKNSVVMLELYDDGELIATGSGFCAFKKNYIVTNFHVIEGANEIKIITNDKQEYYVNNIVVFDYQHDLAILESDAELTPLKFGYDFEIKTGKKIKTIGSPLGEMNTMSTGIISNADNDNGIQISAPISHGSSGGVLLDYNNRVIGITYAGYDVGENLNFAINAKILKHIYNMYEDGEYHTISLNGTDNDNDIEYTLCYPLIEGDLQFEGCSFYDTERNEEYDLYSTSSLNVLYKITDEFLIYDYVESERNINTTLYDSLTTDEKKLAAELYLEIDDDVDITDEDLNNINIIDLIYAISKEQDSSFSKTNLANAVAAVNEIENNTKCFNRVNDMSFSVEEKRLLLLGVCPSFTPSNLTNSDAKGFVDDINDLSLSVSEKSAILRRFGYNVNDSYVTW